MLIAQHEGLARGAHGDSLSQENERLFTLSIWVANFNQEDFFEPPRTPKFAKEMWGGAWSHDDAKGNKAGYWPSASGRTDSVATQHSIETPFFTPEPVKS